VPSIWWPAYLPRPHRGSWNPSPKIYVLMLDTREKFLAKQFSRPDYEPHVRPRGEEQREKVKNPSFKARRRVVEACHSWFNRFRKVTIRYDRLGATHLSVIHLAAAIIALRKIKTKTIYG